MNITHLPIIDWEQGIKLAGNKKELAKEMLQLLIKNIKQDLHAINQSHAEKDFITLHKQLHKLHGALCYCGLPRLKTLVKCLESALKSNIMFNLSSLLSQLDTEVNLLLEHFSHQSF